MPFFERKALQLIENGGVVIEGTNVAEDVFCKRDSLVHVLTDSLRRVCIGADCDDLTSELAEARDEIARGKENAERVLCAGVYLDALILFDEYFEYFVADIAVVAVLKEIFRRIVDRA